MCPNCEKKVSFKKSILLLSFVALGLWSLESYASETQGDHDHSKMNHSKTKTASRKSLSIEAKNSVIAALEANESLHSSFFKYEGKAVQANAMKLKKAIDGIQDKEISKLLNFTKTKLTEIKASNDRKLNNKNYHLVSMALIHIINTYDLGKKYNAYSCPMVKKKWVQNSVKKNKVHNPYAPSMPHCGSKDTNYN